jgi:glucose-1-phosphate adenylyltransferase
MGSRLLPLTEARAKPAVPFGGKYRIIDFALSNLINSGVCSIYVLVQYRSDSLLRHLCDGWQFGSLLQDQFIIPVAAQLYSEEDGWYRGTADAIFQNLNLLDIADDSSSPSWSRSYLPYGYPADDRLLPSHAR